MELTDWLKLVALLNMIAFMWVFLTICRKESPAVAHWHEAMRLKSGSVFIRFWWLTFLLCMSYRLGACATSSPEAITYGLFPTLIFALVLIELAKTKAELVIADKKYKANAAKRATSALEREKAQEKATASKGGHPLEGIEVKTKGSVL